jgi:hypothetical protein
MATIEAAFPFIEVTIDTSELRPVAQRSPSVVAVVGVTPSGAPGGDARLNTPIQVSTLDDAATLFARKKQDGTVAETPLYSSLALALEQDPKPSRIYGVRAEAGKYAAALAGLEAADDVTFVSLAREVDVGAAATDAAAATGLLALKAHVEAISAGGNKRIGVAMVDPARQKSATYVKDLLTAVTPLRSDSSRMVLVAARGATGDVATAAMAAMAGFPPQASILLKPVRGVTIPIEQQYSPSEIKALSEGNVVPIIDPALIPGESLHFAEGRCFTSNADLLYVDIVRVLDDIDFRLKAGLVGAVGDARITKPGLTALGLRTEGILGPLQRAAVIDTFTVSIPVLDILNVPESARTPTDTAIVTTARASRSVDMLVTVVYGPAVHRLKVTLAPKF